MLCVVPLLTTASCDRIKDALKDESLNDAAGDPVWQGDSTLLASKPGFVFRVVESDGRRAVSPIATIGAPGFRAVRMGRRGWRAFDIAYLQSGNTLHAIRDGRVVSDVPMKRGMWEAGSQLDSIQGCRVLIPAGLADVGPGIKLLLAGERPSLKAVPGLSAGELATATSTISTLVAPSAGISTSMLARYKREVHVLPTGVTGSPTIVAIYNDPEQVADSVQPIAQRPRQFLVVLDKGVYGYRSTFTYSTLGNSKSPPRMTYVDFLDTDGDGRGELFFGYYLSGKYDVTVAYKFENDAWRENFREVVRCKG